MTTSEIHRMLRNPIYTGDFRWLGKLYHGSHASLISHATFAGVAAELITQERPATSFVATGERILELVKRAGILYKTHDPAEQRRVLDSVLSNCTFDRGSVYPTDRKPFRPVRTGERNRRMAERVGFGLWAEALAEGRMTPEPARSANERKRSWRRGWDSNPRAPYGTRRFRGAPVTTTSVPLRTGQADPKLYRERLLA